MKHKSSNRKRGSLSRLILRNYIFFTLVILILLGSFYLASYFQVTQILPAIKIDRLLDEVPNLSDEDYSNLIVENYLGKNGRLLLLSEKGETIFTNDANLYSDYLSKEIATIPDYKKFKNSNIPNLSAENKKIPFSLTEESGNLAYKHLYLNKDGNIRTLILLISNNAQNKYLAALQYSGSNLFLFICAYLAIVVAFVRWQTRRTKALITPLNNAITDFTSGARNTLMEYCGPDEMVAVAENFEKFTDDLMKKEWKQNRLDEERLKLLSDISHDLKTPLSVIQSYAFALRDHMVPEDQIEKYLEAIYLKSQKMAEMITAIHEYSKLEHPDFSIEYEPSNLCSLTQLYFAEKYEELEQAGFFLDINIPDKPIMCNLNVKQFSGVFENLINNSIKYNPHGTTIYVIISLNNDIAKITVADNGIGIPGDLVHKLFKPFATHTNPNGNGGSGLGLAITQKIVFAHNGNIKIIYPPHEIYKTQFEITFPVLME